jgi:hypothetical protein
MSIENFKGWRAYEISLPDGGKIICFYFINHGQDVTLYDENHNIFRLDKEGNVMWQIQREENGKFIWEVAHQQAREKGLDGERRPFGSLRLFNAQDEWLQSVDAWHPGLKLITICHGIYEIDIDKGVANNVTPISWRDW